MTRQIPIIFPTVVGVIGLILIGWSAAHLRQARATTRWPSVEGKILRANIRPIEEVREKKQKIVLYAADVAYTYHVNGKEYVSNTIRTDLLGRPHTGEAERLLERYPVGKEVTVFYNPANPSDAVLEPGRNPQTTSLLACGIVLTIVSAIMLVVRFIRPR